MYIYHRLRDVREDHDLLQCDIAKILEITREQYCLYESGKREIPLHHIITLAKYYNISLDYLTGITDLPRTTDGKRCTTKSYSIKQKGNITNNFN